MSQIDLLGIHRGVIRLDCPHCGDADSLPFIRERRLATLCESCGAVDVVEEACERNLREPDSEEWTRARELRAEAHLTISVAIDRYKPSLVVGAFSGGHDSLVSTHVSSGHPAFAGALHINTGIGIERTRTFVRATSWYFGWELFEREATAFVRADGTPDPQVYEDLVLEYGFPGPAHHRKMYDRLKGRALSQFIQERKTHRRDKILICSGLRQQESQRRMGYDEPINVDGSVVWVNPCFSWSKRDCNAYMSNWIMPENLVVRLLCMSGECLCGAFAKKGEIDVIEACFPEEGARLRALEARVKAAGFPWGWDERPPVSWLAHRRGEGFLPGIEPQWLCASCQFKHGNEEVA